MFLGVQFSFLSGGEHTDFGSVTVLLLEDGVEGLEVSRSSRQGVGPNPAMGKSENLRFF